MTQPVIDTTATTAATDAGATQAATSGAEQAAGTQDTPTTAQGVAVAQAEAEASLAPATDAAQATTQQAPAKPGWQEGAERARRQRVVRQRQAEEQTRARQERAQLEQQVRWERAQREQLQQRLDQADAAPLEYLREKGVAPKDLVARAIADQTPEGQVRLLQEKLEAETRARQTWEQKQSQAAMQQQQDAAYKSFLSAAGDKDKYPTLARFSKARPLVLCQEGDAITAAVYARTQTYPSYEQVLAYLEREYSKALKDEPTGNGAAQGGHKDAAKAGQAAGSRTITGRTAERAQLPKSLDEMTPDEQLGHLATQLAKSRG